MNDSTGSSQRTMMFDDADSVNDAIDLLFLEQHISGSYPFAESGFLSRVRDDASLLPAGSSPSRLAVQDGNRSVLAHGPGWVLCATRWRQGNARVSVVAQSQQLARAVFEQATRGAQMPPTVDNTKADVGFWHLGPRGPVRTERSLRVQEWTAIRRNYPAAAQAALDRVMAMGRDALPGKLLLLHGPPGTGKTTALRALADAWRPWCQIDYVLDPERLFDLPAYLMNIALGEGDDDEDGEGGRARLLVLEDCDELIGAAAKDRSGQSLARLLNLTDGLLGQGLSLLVAITTNEPLTALHPAIARPGRCIAEIEVGLFGDDEARAWLGSELPAAASAGGHSLAQLVALRDGTQPVRAAEDEPAKVGQYL